ncbi:hypothetical protein [Sporosarcina luteola]|uniref:hypothetical protein n=1 Tax=Sporosarcina luteola TaxID=582850 RepID=UPI00203E2EE9|nr:hypothetical protein [Sporosarcina luteola]MCM3711523.1 hypothetical protein [Sporosarcina luteola]
MKKYVLFMLLLLSFTFMLSACSQSEEEKTQVYLENNALTFYHFLVVDFTDGELNIEVQMFDTSDTWSNKNPEFDVAVETKILLEAVKKYSKEHEDILKEVKLYFVSESNRTVAEINANNDTLLENNWSELDADEIPQTVDGYKFYGFSN